MRHVSIFAAIVVLVLACVASGQDITSIGGSFDHGDTLYVIGTGFGSKSPAAPVIWDNFDHGTDGDPIVDPVIGEYGRVAGDILGGSGVLYDDAVVYSGSHSALEIQGGNWFNGLSAPFGATASSAFAHMVIRVQSVEFGSMEDLGSKTLRLNTGDVSDPVHGYPNFVAGLRDANASLEVRTNIGSLGGLFCGGVDASEFNDPHDDWWSIGLWADVGTRGNSDGFSGRDYNGNIVNCPSQSFLYDGIDEDGFSNAAFYTHSSPNGSTDLRWWFGEVYADSTLARVAAYHPAGGYPDGGPTAIQVPHYWSDTRIDVVVNTGNYATGDTLGLVVYNASGSASDTYLVVVGESSAAPPDTAPIGAPALTRAGASLDLTWTAPTGYPENTAYYIINITDASDGQHRGVPVDGDATGMNNIEVPATGAIDVHVVAYAADGSIISTSNVVTDTP